MRGCSSIAIAPSSAAHVQNEPSGHQSIMNFVSLRTPFVRIQAKYPVTAPVFPKMILGGARLFQGSLENTRVSLMSLNARGLFGYALISITFYEYQWISLGVPGHPWKSEDINGYPLFPTHGFLVAFCINAVRSIENVHTRSHTHAHPGACSLLETHSDPCEFA